MKVNYMAIGLPIILLITYLEYLFAKSKARKTIFKYESSIANLSIGIADRLFDIFCSTIFYSAYYFIYDQWHFFAIENEWYVWLILLLATDLVWYWYHRLGHEVNILWAAHIVHHHSEEFNYTAAMRITVFQALVRTCFWSILPLIGFPPQMVIPVLLFHGIYSFFTHTRLIGRLGIIEKILITPSHHRVHHASDEKYLDKNYGDIFVFWDKLFGTFKEEEEEPHYGIVHPLESHSFLWQHFHYYFEIWVACYKARNYREILMALFGGPEQMNPAIRKVLERKFRIKKKSSTLKSSLRRYITIQMASCILLLIMIMMFYSYLSFPITLILSISLILTLINCGALLDQKKYVFYLEILRIMIPLLFIAWYFYQPIFLLLMCIVGIILFATNGIKAYYQDLFFETKETAHHH